MSIIIIYNRKKLQIFENICSIFNGITVLFSRVPVIAISGQTELQFIIKCLGILFHSLTDMF